MSRSKLIPHDTKKVFWKKGTCSQTLFFLLNREFGYTKEAFERASDPLAGGIMNKGHQCGMLWGSSLAVGAESFRRHGNSPQAIVAAVVATQSLMESFSKRTKTVNCRTITGCDLTSVYGMAKLGLKQFWVAFLTAHVLILQINGLRKQYCRQMKNYQRTILN